jgi:hypothetical protein
MSWQLHGTVFLEQMIVVHLIKKFPVLMKPKDLSDHKSPPFDPVLSHEVRVI